MSVTSYILHGIDIVTTLKLMYFISVPDAKRSRLTHAQPEYVTFAAASGPSLEVCTEKLSQFYINCQMSSDTWPPLKIATFVQLALVKQREGTKHSDFRTVQKDIDEVCGQKTSISLDDLFTGIDSGSLILLEGRPGSGKTTLMSKISCDWGNKKILPQAKIVILVQLRRLNRKRNIYLHDLIKTACSTLSSDEINWLTAYIERKCGEDVVMMFDGYDEYAPGASEDNFVHKIVTKKFLSKSIVIVSSRPAATTHFREDAKRYIEVVGFLKPQVCDYVRTYYKYKNTEKAEVLINEEKADILIKHLESHPHLFNICYLPLHCAMFVFLSENSTVLPKTETDFYRDFTLSILIRSCRKRRYIPDNQPYVLASFDDLQDREKEMFNLICKMAFEATIESKQVFSYTEIRNIDIQQGTSGSDESSLGLIVIDRFLFKYGLDKTYSFLHLTLQEYLSALYLVKLDCDKIKEIIKEPNNSASLSVTYQFLCGIMDYSKASSKAIFDSILEATSSNHLCHVQCSYEFQCPLSCTHVFNFHDGSFVFKNLIPSDSTSLVYFLANARYDNIEIQLESCSFGVHEYEAVLQVLGPGDVCTVCACTHTTHYISMLVYD